MPTLNKLIKDKLDRLEAIPDALETTVIKVQKQLFADLLEEANKLSLTDGNLDRTSENIAKIEAIMVKIEANMMKGDYIEAVTKYAREFNKQKDVNNQIFEKTVEDFTDKDFYKDIVKSAQRAAVESLTDEAASFTLKPIRDTLLQNVTSGGSLSALVKQLREFAEGNDEVEGKLLRYVKSISRDAFATSDRAYTEAVTTDVGLKWFKYKGGVIKDTRCFCLERVDKVYHIDEIRLWGAKPDLWNCGSKKVKGGGRRQGTNSSTIFQYLGGYNCIHSLVAVAETNVPFEVKQRVENLEKK